MSLSTSIRRLEEKSAFNRRRGRCFWFTLNLNGTFQDSSENIYLTKAELLKGIGYEEGDLLLRFMTTNDSVSRSNGREGYGISEIK